MKDEREFGNWENWLLFMLNGVIETAQQTIQLINTIKELMQEYKHRICSELPKIYSQDLLNNLFKHPYTKIDFMMNDLGVNRTTATGYLESLVELKLLEKQKLGRSNYYVNRRLYQLFTAR